jgi:hypothetical protein
MSRRKSAYRPIIKFNSGKGAILCNKCFTIIKENISKLEMQKTQILFCAKCAKEELDKFINSYEKETKK